MPGRDSNRKNRSREKENADEHHHPPFSLWRIMGHSAKTKATHWNHLPAMFASLSTHQPTERRQNAATLAANPRSG